MLEFIRKTTIIFLLLFTSICMYGQDMYVILLAGQSNMAGRGITRIPTDTVTYSNVLSLNKDSVWVRAKNPLHWDKAEAGVGMGITFAHELALKMGGNVKIGLVPCAAGGTSIDNWNNNAWFGNTGNFYLYTNLIKRAQKATKSGILIGMIWHQGESDATTALYPTYQNKLKTLFLKIRTDLKMPNMPIVAGELGNYLVNNSSYPRWDSINKYINNLKTLIPYYDVASSSSLTSNTDITHFTSASQTILGARYADLFYNLTFGLTPIQNPIVKQVSLVVKENAIHISTNSERVVTIKLFDILGRLRKSTLVFGYEGDISTDNMKGIYIVNIETKTENFKQKVIL